MKKQIFSANKHKDALNENAVMKFKKRMLDWPNPVEYVNNMYGCHPEGEHMEYFKKVFKNEKK